MKKLLNIIINTAQQMIEKVEYNLVHLKDKKSNISRAYHTSRTSLDEQKELRDQYYQTMLANKMPIKKYHQFCAVVAESHKKHLKLCNDYFSVTEATTAAEIYLSLLKADLHILCINDEEFELENLIFHLKTNFSIFNARLNLLIKTIKDELKNSVENKIYLEHLECSINHLRQQLIKTYSDNTQVVSSEPVVISRFYVQDVFCTYMDVLIPDDIDHKPLIKEFNILSGLQRKLTSMEADIFDKFIIIAQQNTDETPMSSNRIFLSLVQTHMADVIKAGILPVNNQFKPKSLHTGDAPAPKKHASTFFANVDRHKSSLADDSLLKPLQ